MSIQQSSQGVSAHESAPPSPGTDQAPTPRTGYVLGIVAILATFVPPGLFAAPVLGALAVVFGAVELRQARRAGRPIDQAVIGMVLGGVALATSLTGIWLFRHVIARAVHNATAGSIG